MLIALVFAAAATAFPVSAPAASPGPVPTPKLKEIAHVRSTSSCAEVAVHANAAIGDALGNDAILDQTVSALRDNALDGNVIERRSALERLTSLSNRLAERYGDGNGEVRRLRALAERAPTPAAKANLLAFANWLGGALWRQKTIGRDLDGFIATLDAKDMARLDEAQASMAEASRPRRDLRPERPSTTDLLGSGLTVSAQLDPRNVTSPPQPTQQTDDRAAQAAAADFIRRTAAIQSDESMAASHASALDTGC